MTWESFYLTCFFIGLLLTVASFVFGGAHLHFHVPVHLPHIGHGHGGGLNLTTLLMFVTWFGGAGYLMTHYRSSAVAVAFTAALIAGFIAGALMNFYIARVFLANEHPVIDSDYEMVGVLGRITVPIRPTGTGELIYSQQGTRRSCGARSDDGREIGRGTEVVVMRYEKGIAYVRPFEELHNETA